MDNAIPLYSADQERAVFAMEPWGRSDRLPLFFTASETTQRRIETFLDGIFVFDPPRPGFVPTRRATGNPLPIDMYGSKDIEYDLQLQYPPANIETSYYNLEPLLFPDKYLHQILDLR